MSDPPPPDPRLLALLREERPAPSDARERARARLVAAIPVMGGGGGGGSGTHVRGAGHGGGAAAGTLGSHGVAMIAFVLGGAAGAGLHAALTTRPSPRVVYMATPAPTAAAPSASVPSDSPPVPNVMPVAPMTESAPPVSRPSSTSGVSQLTAERSLLDGVRASLVQGDPSGALDKLRTSRREFPRAILREERDALAVEALVGARRYDEARAAAEAFREHFPSSLFSGAVDGAIRSIP